MGKFCIVLGALCWVVAAFLSIRAAIELRQRVHVDATLVELKPYSAEVEYEDVHGEKKRATLERELPGFQVGQPVGVYLKDDPSLATLDDALTVYLFPIVLGVFGSVLFLLGIILTFGTFKAIVLALCGVGLLASLGIGAAAAGNQIRLQLVGTPVMGLVTDDYVDHYTKPRSSRDERLTTVARRNLVIQYPTPDQGVRDLLIRAPVIDATKGSQVRLVVDFTKSPPEAAPAGWREILLGLVLVSIFAVVFIGAGVLTILLA